MEDERHLVGARGSESLLFNVAKKTVYSMLKVGGLYDGVILPVSYAWLETSDYGKTTGFSVVKGIAEDAGTFLAVKYFDPKTVGISG